MSDFQVDLDTLYDRLLTIIGPAQRFRDGFEQRLSDGETANQHHVINMLKEFEEFSGAYFRYVAEGEGMREKSAEELLKELYTATNKLHDEWVEISRVCEQRQVDAFQDVLQNSDKQTRQFYDRYLGYKTQSIPITYFGRFTNITRSYFNRYPLISIPLYNFNNAEQIELALAHELGHHIFWNSTQIYDYEEVQNHFSRSVIRSLDDPVDNHDEFRKKEQLVSLWLSWQEETFADVCGTLLAGPDYVRSAISLAAESGTDVNSLTYNDHEHPVPYLRPLISLEVLRWLQDKTQNQELKEQIADIDMLWRGKFGSRLSELRMQHYGTTSDTMDNLEITIPIVVRSMIDKKDSDGKGSWAKYNGDTQVTWENLGNLIDYGSWLNELGDPAASAQKTASRRSLESSVIKAQSANLLQKLDQFPSSESFSSLIERLREKHEGDEEKVRHELLKLTKMVDWRRTPVCKEWGWTETCIAYY